MKKSSPITVLAIGLLCLAGPCAAASPEATAARKPEATKVAPARPVAPGWLQRLLQPAPQPKQDITWPKPEDRQTNDPSSCPVPLDRGFCPVG